MASQFPFPLSCTEKISISVPPILEGGDVYPGTPGFLVLMGHLPTKVWK